MLECLSSHWFVGFLKGIVSESALSPGTVLIVQCNQNHVELEETRTTGGTVLVLLVAPAEYLRLGDLYQKLHSSPPDSVFGKSPLLTEHVFLLSPHIGEGSSQFLWTSSCKGTMHKELSPLSTATLRIGFNMIIGEWGAYTWSIAGRKVSVVMHGCAASVSVTKIAAQGPAGLLSVRALKTLSEVEGNSFLWLFFFSFCCRAGAQAQVSCILGKCSPTKAHLSSKTITFHIVYEKSFLGL